MTLNFLKQKDDAKTDNTKKDKTKTGFSVKNKKESQTLALLDEFSLNINDLALDKIESEAETLLMYMRALKKDISMYKETKKGISKKIKMIARHGLELKNLLANLEDHYYCLILDVLKKAYEIGKKNCIGGLIQCTEMDFLAVKDTTTALLKVIVYNELFNPEKNPNYEEEIEKEAKRGELLKDIDLLINRIMTVKDIRKKIVRNQIEDAKALINASSMDTSTDCSVHLK